MFWTPDQQIKALGAKSTLLKKIYGNRAMPILVLSGSALLLLQEPHRTLKELQS